ncbi:MAG: hypothetical protein QOH69_1028 [Actinomycetota bacterium]|jgi:hypothetical protein|nr:hypothetical protein [Actinomycetota bacterium]
MAESEDDVYRRIAKHNNTTVEQERAKQAERERLRHIANGELPTDADEEITAPSVIKVGANPFGTALAITYIAAFVIGLILLADGSANAGSYNPDDFPGQTDNGIAEIVWGGAFIILGISAAMVHIGASAVIWHLRRDPHNND